MALILEIIKLDGMRGLIDQPAPVSAARKAKYSDHYASMGRQCESTQNSSARLYEPRFFLVFSCRKSLPLTLSSVSLAFLPHESA